MTELFAAFGLDWKLLLIQALNFAVLLFILYKFLYRPMLRVIDERRQKIAEGVRTAEEADTKLALAGEERDAMIGKAAQEAERLVSGAKASAGEEGQRIIRTAEERAAALISDAEARAKEEERQAILRSEKDIARAAMLAAEKILRTSK